MRGTSSDGKKEKERILMGKTYLSMMRKGEDFTADLSAEWGPETEMGRLVHLGLNVELLHKEGRPDYCLSIFGDLRIKECAKLGLHAVHVAWQCPDMADILDKSGLRCAGLEVIVPIWKKWAGNDMRSGSKAQEEFLEKFQECHPEWRYNYEGACILLKGRDLYYDKNCIVDGKPYAYGTGWIFRKIPRKVLEELCRTIDRGLEIIPKGEQR